MDAFTREAFKGNPAAVCLLDQVPEDNKMLNIAAEMNLSETAFVQALEGFDPSEAAMYSIRWFTPKIEVPLCGHATLAASKVIFDELGFNGDKIIFKTLNGEVESRRCKDGYTLYFPADEPVPVEPPSALLKAMGISDFGEAVYGKNTNKLVILLKDEQEIKNLKPDFEKMKLVEAGFPLKGVGVTAKGNAACDIISRYFNPWAGVNEDPVTGSVHTLLAPYWTEKLGKSELKAFQASERGGEILIRMAGKGRVEFTGDAVIIIKGNLYL